MDSSVFKNRKLPDFSSLEGKIFKGKKVLDKAYCEHNDTDWAMIQLAERVPEEIGLRVPLTSRTTMNGLKEKFLCTIGHPVGVHRTFTPNGGFYKPFTDNVTFLTDLDTFRGNSGSPILNMETARVEGILIRGYSDVFENEEGCYVNKKYTHEDIVNGTGGEIGFDRIHLASPN